MFKYILTTFFTRIFIAASNLFIAILLSNYIGAAGRGEQSLIITLITFIIIISSVIGSSSISYLLPRFPFITLVVPSVVWVILISTASYFVLPRLNLVPSAFTGDVCFLSLMLAVMNLNTAILISKQRINAANWVGFLQAFMIIAILLVYFIFLQQKTIRVYIIALYIGYGSALGLSTFLILRYFREIQREPLEKYQVAFKKLAILGFFNQTAIFTQLLSFRLSYYILDANFGKEMVGVYANAVSIAESVWLIGRSIATVQGAKIVNSHDTGFSIDLTSRMNRINLLISIVLLLILSFIPDSWYVWIFGEEFTGINRMIWFLAPGILFFGIVLIVGYYFSSTGKHHVNALASTAGLVVTLILGFTIIPLWNSSGAAITATVSYAITALIILFFFAREKKFLN
jgi:O-antigen/teichoic acid export membrane protein